MINTTDGGAVWSLQTLPEDFSPATGVSCPTTTNCSVVGDNSNSGGVLAFTTDGGAVWSSSSGSVGPYLYGVSCPTSSDCVAVGEGSTNAAVARSSDGGQSWTTGSIPISVKDGELFERLVPD